jgi:hypothetical protein
MASSPDHYLRDLGYLIKEAALSAKAEAAADPGDYTRGQLMAFYEVVSLMQSQAVAFEMPFEQLSLEGFDPDRDLL